MATEYTFAIHTLGCKVNQYDSSRLEQALLESGLRLVDFEDVADVYIVNTCAVTSTASRKSRQMVRSLRRRHPDARIAIIGCYSEIALNEDPGADEFAVVESLPVDLTLGVLPAPDSAAAILSLLEGVDERDGSGSSPAVVRPTRPVVVAQRGCDGGCTYCLIPRARGPLDSLDPADVIEGVRTRVEGGAREVVLAGIHLGAYGRDAGADIDLKELILRIVEIPGSWRLRISSLEPMDLDADLLGEILDHPRVAPHLHLPLQSGSNSVLARMGRGYDTSSYANMVEDIRRYIDFGLTTDVMVGFPGETEPEHRESLAFVKRMQFGRIHVFPYSPRPKTPAASFPGRVDGKILRRRRDEFLDLARESARKFHRAQLGKTLEVLLEEPVGESRGGGRGCVLIRGYAGNYAPVRVRTNARDALGDVVPVEIEGYDDEGCWGGRISGPDST